MLPCIATLGRDIKSSISIDGKDRSTPTLQNPEDLSVRALCPSQLAGQLLPVHHERISLPHADPKPDLFQDCFSGLLPSDGRIQ